MDFLKNLRVTVRLALAGCVLLLGLASIAGYTVVKIRSDAVAAHKERIKNIIEVSKGVIGYYQQQEKEGKLSLEEAQSLAKEALRKPRFSKDDYYFLYDYEGRSLMHAGNPKTFEGKIWIGKTDVKGYKLWDEIVRLGKGPGAGFIEYWFPRANSTIPKPKLGYVESVRDWQWIIGTGVYIDDVDAAVYSAALRYSLMSLAVLIIIALVAWLVSKSIVNQLGGEPQDAATTMKQIANGNLNVDIPLEEGDNSSLMASLKLMQMKLTNLTSSIRDDSSSLTENITKFESQLKSYIEAKTDDKLLLVSRSVRQLGRTANVLGESVNRFKL
jgi:methyl-accepting chemotaxis protein